MVMLFTFCSEFDLKSTYRRVLAVRTFEYVTLSPFPSSLTVLFVYVTKACRWNRGIAPLIINFDKTWRWVSFLLRPLYPRFSFENKLTPMSKVLLEDLTFSQLIKVPPAFNLKVIYRIHKSPPVVSLLSQANLVHAFQFYSLRTILIFSPIFSCVM